MNGGLPPYRRVEPIGFKAFGPGATAGSIMRALGLDPGPSIGPYPSINMITKPPDSTDLKDMDKVGDQMASAATQYMRTLMNNNQCEAHKDQTIPKAGSVVIGIGNGVRMVAFLFCCESYRPMAERHWNTVSSLMLREYGRGLLHE